jgi:hypothetical protein
MGTLIWLLLHGVALASMSRGCLGAQLVSSVCRTCILCLHLSVCLLLPVGCSRTTRAPS